MSEAEDTQLETRLAEQDEFEPPAEFVDQANVTDESIYEEFDENAADKLDWFEDYDQVLDDPNLPIYECVDRHLDERADEAAIEWVVEPVDAAQPRNRRGHPARGLG